VNEILVFFCLKGLFTPTESLLKVSHLPTLRVRMCLFSIGCFFSKDLHHSVISENAKRFNKKCFVSFLRTAYIRYVVLQVVYLFPVVLS
jgi:hypothetical protein